MFKRVKENRIYKSIVDQILEAIYRGDLKVNDKLPSENELSQIFGVSRVTVREAIRSLEQAGMVEVRQGSLGGAYIKEVDLEILVTDIGRALKMSNLIFPNLAEARALLEEMILRSLKGSKLEDVVIQKLEENISVSQEHARANRNKERLVANFQFHTLIAELTKNPIILLMHRLIVGLSIPFFENVKATPQMAQRTKEDHQAVVDLLKKRKFVKAGELCAAHIRETSSRIMEKSKNQSLLPYRQERGAHEKAILSGR